MATGYDICSANAAAAAAAAYSTIRWVSHVPLTLMWIGMNMDPEARKRALAQWDKTFGS